MGGKISDNTDVFENILTLLWRKNPHPKRVRILTRLLKVQSRLATLDYIYIFKIRESLIFRAFLRLCQLYNQ